MFAFDVALSKGWNWLVNKKVNSGLLNAYVLDFYSSADDVLKAFVAPGRSAIFWPIDMPQYPNRLVEFHFKCVFPIFTQQKFGLNHVN